MTTCVASNKNSFLLGGTLLLGAKLISRLKNLVG